MQSFDCTQIVPIDGFGDGLPGHRGHVQVLAESRDSGLKGMKQPDKIKGPEKVSTDGIYDIGAQRNCKTRPDLEVAPL